MTPLLEDILELTDRVQASIDAGDWQHANELETERRAKLEQLLQLEKIPLRFYPLGNC